MKLKLIRHYLGNEYTIGKLYIDDEYFCDTLEDKDRGLRSDMTPEELNKLKIRHETAIPYGTYRIALTWSPKFKRILPRLHSVPGFDGILIHNGNHKDHTSGCILVGINDVVGKVTNSMATLSKLMDMLKKVDDITISIIKK